MCIRFASPKFQTQCFKGVNMVMDKSLECYLIIAFTFFQPAVNMRDTVRLSSLY